jgi:two-component system cell cycle sensor histidine kinase/response regulator CckA
MLTTESYERLLGRFARLETEVGTAGDLLTVCRALHEFAAASAPCNGMFISRYDAERDRRICIFAITDGEEQNVALLPPMPMNNSPQSRAVRTGQIVMVDDFQSAVANQPVVNLGLHRDPRLPQSALTIPMKVRGRVVGAFEIQSVEPAAYRQEHAAAMQMAGNLAAIAMENLDLLKKERDQRRAVEASETRFRSLIEHSADATVAFQADGTIVYASPATTRILGYLEAEMLVTNLFTVMHPDDLAAMRERLARLSNEPGRIEFQTVRCRHRDGTWRWIAGHTRNLLQVQAVHAFVGNYQDVTDKIRAEAALRESEERLRQAQKMESIGQLAGGVAHDFNNLLTVIQGHTSLLLASGQLHGINLDSAQQIAHAAGRAGDLTRQLLTFSRNQAMELQVVDLNRIVREMSRMLQRVLGETIQLEAHCCAQPTPVKADAGMMEQVLMNLAVNARDAMPHGGRLTLTTAHHVVTPNEARQTADATPGSYVQLRVRDTGTGIAPEHLPRIFDPFFTTKEAGKGTGLGLATVYGIVKQHGGWVRVHSRLGEGSEFEILLPPAAMETTPARETRKEPERMTGGNETILVVEDDANVRSLVCSVLERFGYRVLEATSGQRALEIWRQEKSPVHLVMTDLVMPDGVTGREVAEHILAARPQTKIVYTSGYGVGAVGSDLTAQKGVRFIQKPYPVALLARTIRECLDSA